MRSGNDPGSRAERRAFLKWTAAAGALLAAPALRGARVLGAAAGPEKTEPPAGGPSPEPATRVLEARYVELRDEEGAVKPSVLDDAVLGLMQVYTGDYPLDALASIFLNDPPVSVLVDARAGHPGTTSVLATGLAAALRDMGSPGESIVVTDASDADLTAGGYRIVREGEGPL